MDEKEYLIDWFSQNSNISKEFLLQNSDKNYFESKWLDSFQFINLITNLESTFDIVFDNDEFQNPDLTNIEGLSEIIKAKLK